MELYIHYQQLPQGKELADVVGELNATRKLSRNCLKWHKS